MKKIVGIISALLCLHTLYSQTELTFCTAVDPNGGYCVLNNTKFISSPDSSTQMIYMKVKNSKGIPSSKIVYKIYSIDKKGVETYFHSFEQNIQNGWDSSWQPDHFPSPGIYRVKVYNDLSQEICNNTFELRTTW